MTTPTPLGQELAGALTEPRRSRVRSWRPGQFGSTRTARSCATAGTAPRTPRENSEAGGRGSSPKLKADE
eukprot:6112026-Pyramimonas_sp.AAC.1